MVAFTQDSGKKVASTVAPFSSGRMAVSIRVNTKMAKSTDSVYWTGLMGDVTMDVGSTGYKMVKGTTGQHGENTEEVSK